MPPDSSARETPAAPPSPETAQARADQLFAVSSALGGALTTAEVTDVIIGAALPIFQAGIGFIALLSDDATLLRAERIVGVPPEQAEPWREIPLTARVPLADAVRERRLVHIPTAAEHDAAYPVMAPVRAEVGPGALVALPLLAGERCIGGLGLVCPADCCQSPDEQTFLWTLAGQCALALERARLFDAERQAREDAELRLSALRRSREDLELAVNAAQLGTFFCDWPFDKITWNDTCKQHFFLPADAEVDFKLFYSLLHPDDREPTRIAIDRALSERVEYNVEYRTLAPDGRTRWVNAVGRIYYDLLGHPLRFDGVTQDISARKQTEQELTDALRRAALLNQIGQAIRLSSVPDIIQSAAASALGEALGVDRAFFTLFALPQDRATVGKDYCRADLLSLAGDYRLSDLQLNPIALYADRQTLTLSDAFDPSLPASLAAALRATNIRAFLSVPLFNDNVLVGALAVATADVARDWTPDEVALVETVAEQTRTALESARLQEREHRIATELQDALQPAAPAHIPGLQIAPYFKPALDEARIGGDFFDVFPLDKEQYALVIGDVSGKGLAAAAQLATVRNSLRTTLYLSQTPAEAVTSLNNILMAHDLLLGFVTAFVGIYDAGTGRITYASCGHEPPLIRRALSGAIETLETTGPPLGAAENIVYGELSVTLSPGDTVLLYTDGLSEAGPDRRHLLGTDGLIRFLSNLPERADVQSSAAQIVADANAFSNGAFRDDVCVLLARRQ